MQIRILAAYIGAAIAWGTTGVATRAALNNGLPPIGLTSMRAVIATAVLYVLARSTGRALSGDRATWSLGSMMALFNLALPFIFVTFAYRYASVGFVGFIIALIPLATAVLAHYILADEPLHLAKVSALTVAMVGVATLLLSGDSGLADGGRPLLAAALTGAGVLSIGLAGVLAKRSAGSYDPITLTTTQFAVGAVLLVPLTAVTEGIPSGMSAWGWFLIIYLSVVGSVVPFLLYYWVLHHVSSTRAATIGYLVPIVALGTGIVFLGEQLQPGLVVGGMLILAGVLMTGRSESKRALRVRAG